MKKDDFKDAFLILGMANGGLFLARQLRKQWPEATIYAVGTPDDIGQYSNTLNGFYQVSSEDALLGRIDEVVSSVSVKVKAYMCSNPMLESIVLHYPELFDILEFENEIDLYRRIVDKSEVDKLCRTLDITRPEEYVLDRTDDSSIRFPVVVKPLEKANAIGASKCAYINTRDELKTYMEKMSRLGIDSKSLVCQQLVRGDNRWEYGYGGFFQDGKPLVDIIFHQFIQVPQGLCCYSREMTDSALRRVVLETVQPFLEETRYNGFLEFDIKQDQDSKVLYMLDINPRPWRSVDMLAGKLGDSTVFSPKLNDTKVLWRYPFRELLRKKNNKNISYKLCKSIAPGHFVTHLALNDESDRAPYRKQKEKDRKDLLDLIMKRIQK